MPVTQHKYGWIPSLPDKRDELYAFTFPAGIVLPPELDWRTEFFPPILDQDGLGACTAFAGKYALQYADYFAGQPKEDISELFQYYEERVIEHSTWYDAGANMRDIFKVMQKYGMVPESLWPYVPTEFSTAPPKDVLAAAKTDRIKSYHKVAQVRSYLQSCLALRRAFLVGVSVYESFESAAAASTGIIPLPDTGKEKLLGGHAICCVGYSDKNQWYIFLNSWGQNWGDHGCMYIPYAYIEDYSLSGDCYTLTAL